MHPIVPIVAGNWKMNGLKANLSEVAAIRDAADAGGAGRADVVLCVPATLVGAAADLCKNSKLAIGAQDAHASASGAHTGDISAHMLGDSGARYIILGHSERRANHNESNAAVLTKVESVLANRLQAIVCVGETGEDRAAGNALKIVEKQLHGSLDPSFDPANIIIAYEPVWAIGTGLIPTPDDIADMHAFIRQWLEKVYFSSGTHVRILYGGSVKPDNAAALMAIKNVNGALVGGASLKAGDFMTIAAAYR